MQSLVILGGGGNVYDILDIVDAINARALTWHVAGLLDDARPRGSDVLGLPVLGSLREACLLDECLFINAIRSEISFRRMPEILAATGLKLGRFATLVHPQASVSSRATLGADVFVNAGVSVAGDVHIGNHVSLGPGCIIGHNAVIQAYSVLAPGAILSGSVHLAEACYVGAAAVIRQRLHIGAQALIGMGAVVVKDVAAGATVVGNPARPLSKKRQDTTQATAL